MSTDFHDSVSDALENLIEQFSDVYCFYRELIQNSLDAGTNRVDVSLEFKPSEQAGKDGVMIIHVDDYGEGMNREIIDTQLTRLFSSSKENDLTKIGKFGIGFVSVFAIKPDAVIIDTSRDGEDWRIIFNRDKTFSRFKRDFPVDGTKTQIIKTCNEKFFGIFREKSHKTVQFWCKHSEAEIYFEDELINENFEVESPLKVQVNASAGELVAGYTRQRTPFYGFYNQGLTLIEGFKTYVPHVTFKIKSKYLEHTLTRDNIREDENYWKAMDLLGSVVKTNLPSMLFKTLENELLSSSDETALYKELLWFAMLYLADPTQLPKNCQEMKLARDTEGGYITVGEIAAMKMQGVFYFDESDNDIVKILTKEKKRVVMTRAGSELHKQLESLSQAYWKEERMFQASFRFFRPILTDAKLLTVQQKSLISTVDYINKKMGNRTEPLRFANFDYPGSCISDRVYVMQENPGQLTVTEETFRKGNLVTGLFKLFSKTRTLILNENHAYVKGLLKLSVSDRELAAYFLTKLLYLDDGIETRIDSNLAFAAMERSVR